MSDMLTILGAPLIHGEMLKLGIEVSQTTVGRHMVRRHGQPPRMAFSESTTARESRPTRRLHRFSNKVALEIFKSRAGCVCPR